MKATIAEGKDENLITFWCPGCKSYHGVPVKSNISQARCWTWNGDLEKPTLAPSLLIQYNGADSGKDGAPPSVCHLFVINGQIQYISDSTHALAGKTVEMVDEK